jgi:hypothetical protein
MMMIANDDKEWELPPYFSPFPAESEQVVLKIPASPPAFLKKKKVELPPELPEVPELELPELEMPEEAFGPLAKEILEAAPVTVTVIEGSSENSPGSASGAGSSSGDGHGRGKGGGSGFWKSSSRRDRLIGIGVLLIGIGFGLMVVHKMHSGIRELDSRVAIAAARPKPTFPKMTPAAPVAPPILTAPGPADIISSPSRSVAGFWIVRVAGNRAALRSGPGRQYKVISEIPTGSRWKVRKWDGEWFQVEPEDLGPNTLGIGWVRNDLVKAEGNGGWNE